MILYRPVGLQEFALIYDSGMKAFPARLPQQPIFYPVLQLEYARQTASEWNATREELAGYVTQFKVEDEYIGQFEEHTVGGSQYQELWIPAEEVEELNRHLLGPIKVLEGYFGDAFQGYIPEKFGLRGKNAVEQFTELSNTFLYRRMDFYLEIRRNHKAVFLHYPFWQKYNFKNHGMQEKMLQAIREAWLASFPHISLPLPPAAHEETPLTNPARRPVKHLFDADEDDFTPLERLPSDAQPSIDSFEEEAATDEELDSGPYAQHLRGPAHEDHIAEEQSDVYGQPAANPVEEYAASPDQTGPSPGRGDEKYHETIAELFRAVEEDPEDVAAHTSLGVAFYKSGEDDRALACYETALKLDPIYAEAHYFRANILYRQGDVREAIAGYTVAIGLQPDLIEAHLNPAPEDRLTDFTGAPAEMYWIARPARRILDLSRSLEVDPGQARLFKERAAEYYRLRNYAQAITDYTAALAIEPGDANALHMRGQAYEQLGQSSRALEDYQQAMALDAQLSNDYINRGIGFAQTGNYRQALASLTEAIRLAPQNPDGYFNRGMTYVQQGDFESAIGDFSDVIRLTTTDEEAYYWRGISHEAVGRRDQAIADYRKFLTLSHNPRTRKEIERKLSQWKVGEREPASNPIAALLGRHKLGPIVAEKGHRMLDIDDVIRALGKRALDSTWFGRDLECRGEKAEELYAVTAEDKPVEGRDLLQLTAGIRQTTRGDFQAFDPAGDSPWVFIRAWDGMGFYVETNDPRIKEKLRARLPSAEEVEGASPSYEGLFVHI